MLAWEFDSRRVRRTTLSLLGALVLSGCGMGALGQAQVVSDCDKGQEGCKKSPLDAPLATGASLSPEFLFSLRGSGAPSLHFEAADVSVLGVTADGVKGKASGLSALLLVSDSGTVLDFFHIWVKSPTSLEVGLLAVEGTRRVRGPIELLVGESIRLRASLLGDGQRLAGEVDYSWSLSSETSTLLSEGQPDMRRLVAIAPGKATLTVRALERTSMLEITVVPASKPSRTETGGSQ